MPTKKSVEIPTESPSPLNPEILKTKLNGIFRVALKAISWASGVELNYTRKRQRYLLRLQNVFFIFVTFLRFYFYLNVFYIYVGKQSGESGESAKNRS